MITIDMTPLLVGILIRLAICGFPVLFFSSLFAIFQAVENYEQPAPLAVMLAVISGMVTATLIVLWLYLS